MPVRGGHVVVDITGWFTGATAAASSEGLFTPVDPTRLLDTRTTTAPATGTPLHRGGKVATYEVVIRDEQDRRLCTARMTSLIMERRRP